MTIHAAPTITACCRIEVERLPDDDRITSDRRRVTCGLREVDQVAVYLAHQILSRHPARSSVWVASHVGLDPRDVEGLRCGYYNTPLFAEPRCTCGHRYVSHHLTGRGNATYCTVFSPSSCGCTRFEEKPDDDGD